MDKGRILFICRGNTCRSQMAAALVNAQLSDTWIAISGGIKIGNERDCRTATVLQEIGIDTPIPSARLFSTYDDSQFDIIMTLDAKAEQHAKQTFPEKTLIHQDIADPFQDGDNFLDCQHILEADLLRHRQTRDDILAIVLPLIKQISM